MPLFSAAVNFECSPEALFDFLIQPANVMRVSPPELNGRLLEAPPRVQLGDQIRIETKYMGVSQHLVVHIVAWEQDRVLTDEQLEGPFRSFRHERLFEPIENGVRLTENIDYEPPGGMLGFLLTPRRIEKYIAEMYDFRVKTLREILTPQTDR